MTHVGARLFIDPQPPFKKMLSFGGECQLNCQNSAPLTQHLHDRHKRSDTMRIAILDSEADLGVLIARWLAGPTVNLQGFADVDAMLPALHQGDIDLVVVNWDAGIKAQELRDALARQTTPVPVLLLATAAVVPTMLAWLSDTSCDYLIKPVRRTDLVTRISVLQQRFLASRLTDARRQFGPYVFDTHLGQVRLNQRHLPLTQKEFQLSLLLFRHLGRTLSRAFILESVWPEDADLSSRSVDTHISRVRTKLGLVPTQGFRLLPVYGFGYRLEHIKRERAAE